MKGKLITFEGIEGSGKTTQIKLLSDYLKKDGYCTEVTFEPGGTRIGTAIRKILLNPEHIEIFPSTELLLYFAARTQIVNEKLKPWLNQGKIVLCDRYEDSTTAYQHYGRGLDIGLIKMLRENFVGLMPDLTFLVDVPVDVGLDRSLNHEFGKPDRIESLMHEFHERVREGYLEVASENQERIKVIDGSLSEDAVFSCVSNYVDQFLKK